MKKTEIRDKDKKPVETVNHIQGIHLMVLNDPERYNNFVVSNPHKHIVSLSGLKGGDTIPAETYNLDLKKKFTIKDLESSLSLKIAFDKHWLYPSNKVPTPKGLSNFDCSKSRSISKEEDIKVRIDRKLGGIGDVLFTSVVTRAIKETYPNSRIVYGINTDYYKGTLKTLVEHNPYVDKIIDCEEPDSEIFDFKLDLTSPAMHYESTHQPNIKKSRIECHLAYSRIFTENRIPVYHVRSEEHDEAVRWLKKRKYKDQVLVGIELRCNAKQRDWPIEYFKSLVDMILKDRKDVKIILFDHLDDKAWKQNNVYGCIGEEFTLVAGLMEICDYFIALDSGLLHLAGALEVPLIAICGQIDGLMRMKEYKDADYIQLKGELPCVPCWYTPRVNCGRKCLTELTPEMVYGRIKERF